MAAIARAVAVASRPNPAALKNRTNETSILIVNLPTPKRNRKKSLYTKTQRDIVRFSANHVKFVNEQL